MSLLKSLRRWFVKWFLICISVWVRLRTKYGQVSIIKNKVLSYAPIWKKPTPTIFHTLTENIGNDILNRLQQVLNKHGDHDCFVNGYFSMIGKTSTCGEKSKSLSNLIKDSRLYAAAFWNAGLRKGNDCDYRKKSI